MINDCKIKHNYNLGLKLHRWTIRLHFEQRGRRVLPERLQRLYHLHGDLRDLGHSRLHHETAGVHRVTQGRGEARQGS